MDTIAGLTRLGQLAEGSAQICAHACPPMFKLYVLNGEDVFFGLYPIARRRIALPSGDRDIYDQPRRGAHSPGIRRLRG